MHPVDRPATPKTAGQPESQGAEQFDELFDDPRLLLDADPAQMLRALPRLGVGTEIGGDQPASASPGPGGDRSGGSGTERVGVAAYRRALACWDVCEPAERAAYLQAGGPLRRRGSAR